HLLHLSGESIVGTSFLQTRFASVSALLDRAVKPLKMKTDYVRLRLVWNTDHWLAIPVPGKSASLSTLSQADAFMILEPGEEPISAGSQINAFLFP
ncbi:MAG TPA: hypothetical protein VKE92_05580, partial [Anaerolineales bacterium]|nr:hypothetical protein [Anaerolineales bacterium]